MIIGWNMVSPLSIDKWIKEYYKENSNFKIQLSPASGYDVL